MKLSETAASVIEATPVSRAVTWMLSCLMAALSLGRENGEKIAKAAEDGAFAVARSTSLIFPDQSSAFAGPIPKNEITTDVNAVAKPFAMR